MPLSFIQKLAMKTLEGMEVWFHVLTWHQTKANGQFHVLGQCIRCQLPGGEGEGGPSRFGRSEKKTLLPTIETKSPRMSGLLPSPHTDSVNHYLTNVENRVSS